MLVATTNYFPRAIISRHKIINADFSYVPLGANGAGATGNVYFSGIVNANGNSDNLPIMAQAAAADTSNIPFPTLPKSCTPSVNLYMSQNQKFEDMRRRFLT